MQRLHKALAGIGLENDDVDALVGKINVNGVEELMLSSYSMMSYIRDYLKDIGMPYEEAHKIPDLYVALHLAILTIDKTKSKSGYVMLKEEADKMEFVSRACFCWLRVYKKLDAKIMKMIDASPRGRQEIFQRD